MFEGPLRDPKNGSMTPLFWVMTFPWGGMFTVLKLLPCALLRVAFAPILWALILGGYHRGIDTLCIVGCFPHVLPTRVATGTPKNISNMGDALLGFL